MKALEWIKTLARVVRTYDKSIQSLRDDLQDVDKKQSQFNKNLRYDMNNAVELIKRRTDVSADVSATHRNPSQIIMVGRYRNRDYVQVFTIREDDFGMLIHQLRDMERYGQVTKIDAPMGLREMIIDRATYEF
jgi:hypothetical protein